MEEIRNSYHQGLIPREVAMYRLMMRGLSPINADRFLRCLRAVPE